MAAAQSGSEPFIDYSIWSSLANKLYKVKIQSVEHLCQRLGKAWDEISQDEISRSIAGFRGRLKACIAAEEKRIEYHAVGYKQRNTASFT